MTDQSDNLVIVSLSNRMGGAEQCLQMIADTSGARQIFLHKSTVNCLPPFKNEKVRFLTQKSLVFGFMLLPAELFKYRKQHIILSSAVYLNAYLGFLNRIGYLKSQIIARESTSVFIRFTGIKRATYKLAYKLGYPSIRLIICQTKDMRDQFIKHNGFIDKDKVMILPNPINLEHILERATENICLETGEFICAAGRLIPIKGFLILIKAFKDLIDDGFKLKLLILGDGPEKPRLIEAIKDLELEGLVILKGHVTNPQPYFRQAKVCVVSSILEGFPNVLLQMLAVNDTVVSTLCAGDIDPIPAIVKVQPNNQFALFTGIKKALKKATDTNNNRAALNSYLQRRSPESFIKKLKFELK